MMNDLSRISLDNSFNDVTNFVWKKRNIWSIQKNILN